MELLAKVWDLLGGNATEIIALCALFFTAYQTHATRRHNILSVQPHLTTFVNRDRNQKTGTLSVALMNNGLGPARILSYRIYLDGKEINADVSKDAEAVIKQMLGERQYTYRLTTLGNDYAMSTNESKDILLVQFSLNKESDFEEVERQLNRFDLVVNYDSMYGKHFIYDSRMNGRSHR